MALPTEWNTMSASKREKWLSEQVSTRDAVLAGLVEQMMPSMSGSESHHRRALLDAYLAILAADTADKNAATAKTAANRLTVATWGLVFFTAVLVIVTIIVGLD